MTYVAIAACEPAGRVASLSSGRIPGEWVGWTFARLVRRFEGERRRINAVALTIRRGAIGKDVSQVSITSGAQDLGADHPKHAIGFGAYLPG